MLYMYLLTGIVNIANCTFQNNSNTVGGAVYLDRSTATVRITNCTFQSNRATFNGGAICIILYNLVMIDNLTFFNNTAVRGAAVYASNTDDIFSTNQLGHLILQEVIVENNHCISNVYQKIRGGAIFFNRVQVDIIGDTITGSQFLSNSPLGAITGGNGFLQLYGNVSFKYNKGENGGAINLYNVSLTFSDMSTVEFFRNVTTGFGGAEKLNDATDVGCAILYDANISSVVTFTDNHAQQGGHAVYATPIYECSCIQTGIL